MTESSLWLDAQAASATLTRDARTHPLPAYLRSIPVALLPPQVAAELWARADSAYQADAYGLPHRDDLTPLVRQEELKERAGDLLPQALEELVGELRAALARHDGLTAHDGDETLARASEKVVDLARRLTARLR